MKDCFIPWQQMDSARGTPVIPLPPIVPDQEPVAPLPPEIGMPDQGQIPVIPLPPFVPDQSPVAPLPPEQDPGQIPVIPLPPIVPDQNPVYPGPGRPPAHPGPSVPNFSNVRFLNAAYSYDPMRITVGSKLITPNLPTGSMTGYNRIPDGFRTVTISVAATPRVIMFQKNIPFNAGETVTMAIIRTAAGLDLIRISDTPCTNRPTNRACIRTVNLAFNSPALDLFLNDGRLIFSDIRYKEVTSFKQARPRDYGFYVAETPYLPTPYFTDIETVEETPIVLNNLYLSGFGDVEPLLSFFVDAKANAMYTIYILGEWVTTPRLRVKVVEDFM